MKFAPLKCHQSLETLEGGIAPMPEEASSRKSQIRAQFNAVAPEYDSGPGCFAHFGRRLVTAAEIQPGHRVLDVASGRGAVLFPCAERIGQTGEVIGVDLADEMVRATNAEAAQRGVSGRVHVMDAEHLDFADSTFDRVLCGFGIMSFPDQMRALSEFRRVMKPGGRIALSTWRVSPTSEIQAAIPELGIQYVKLPGSITEPEELAKLLVAAGFTSVSVKMDSHSFRYADVGEYWRQARGTGMRRVLDALSAADAGRLRDALTGKVNPDGPREFFSTSIALLAVASR
jgi:ubiquinone/menaquinone biosynthesis C-methylase UbiE